MISRLWHGWTTRDNAAAYENLLRREVLPGIHRVQGFQGAQLLRRDGEKEVEFVTITRFESMRAEARKLLSRFDERSAHYETVFRTD
jgi:heme-degrading monooxygenase HmoA